MTFGNRKGNKYGVAPADERRYKDVLYHSKTEMLRAMRHDEWKDRTLHVRDQLGGIQQWFRQVTIRLGPDTSYKVDFIVIYDNGGILAEDVKGYRGMKGFTKTVSLWRKYMDFPLVVVTRRNGKWIEEVVDGTAS